jgi:hypothetical protein
VHQAIPPVPIASIQLGPAFDSLEVGATKMNWLVILRDAAGREITGRPLTGNRTTPASRQSMRFRRGDGSQ